MKFAVLSHPVSDNIGNEIQSVAAEKLLPQVDMRIPITELSTYRGEQVLLVMNSFFSERSALPPSPNITPLYIAFYMGSAGQRKYATAECIEHFKQHQPIGCRDKVSMQFFQDLGIEAYYSGCLTLTMPLRERARLHNYAVDYPRRNRYFSGEMYGKRECISVSHKHNFAPLGSDITFQMARNLLTLYQSGKHIYTSRLHCALPGAAMGIPVTYLGVREGRTDCLLELGERLELPPLKWRYALNKPDLIHVKLDQAKVREHKRRLVDDFSQRLQSLLNR